MATLALSLAGQVVGGMVGGPFGATIGRALGALAGSAVDQMLFGQAPEGRQGSDLKLQGSSEGSPIPRVYGWNRLTGNIIWATELEAISPDGAGAKGASPAQEDEIAASFALALCEGEVHRIGRIWADGQLLETEGLSIRSYFGTEAQLPDGLIKAKQGHAPAYRGLCYLVFERLPLLAFGNRIPNISVEVCRVVGDLEPEIRAITVIPGATEFGYDPVPRVRVVSPGVTANENAHMARQVSDWTLSIDELQALCPNLEHVSLVVAWFGDDLRASHCRIKPRVESAARQIEGTSWGVAGLTRATAPVVTSHGGAPAYGGTPSDNAVRAAIADLRARGLKVTLYPMVLMDVPTGNSLPNPYGGTGQPAYPWRGRITCHPAPGMAGTPDRTAAAAAQVGVFTEGAWGYRQMVTHYAQLAVASGGVDALIIGSEMRGLSTVRGSGNSFPFVAALVALAAEVRAIVGPDTRLTYAADWTEFSGYQPGGGEKFFHLDPLWASANIDAVGIDYYMPVSDWRDGDGHADAQAFNGPYDEAYLRANIAGGEGFDWYYASDADRIAGVRSPISDGLGEAFVWRFKDIAGWWGNAHHDRPGGVRNSTSTVWVPGSKPIWFTELGCGAVDKGANQPNVFGDPKSIESARPYFSTGAADPLMQRQVLRAHVAHWSDPACNPASTVFDGRMIDTTRLYFWTWDARPYPAFPADLESWSDGANHATGHWLTGRLGAMAADELLKAIAADHGVALTKVDALPPLVHGTQLGGVMTCREALAEASGAAGLMMRDGDTGLVLGRAVARQAEAAGELVAGDVPLMTRKRPDPSERIGRVALTYVARERGYLTGTVTAMQLAGGATKGENSGLVLDLAGARGTAERLLTDLAATRETIDLTLPPSMAGLEVGDVIAVAGQDDGPFEITEIRDGLARRVSARALAGTVAAAIVADRPQASAGAAVPRAQPVVALAHLPGPGGSRLMGAAVSTPWPGDIVISATATGAELLRLTRPGVIGDLAAGIGPGPVCTLDRGTQMMVRLYAGHLSSVDDEAMFAGANRIALETDAGGWELIGFGAAELVAPGLYRLTQLLRGLDGTDQIMGTASVGRRVVLLDNRVVSVPVEAGWLGQTLALRAYAGAADAVGAGLSLTLTTDAHVPLSPVHLRARRTGSDVVMGWTRRSRSDADSWAMAEAPLDVSPEAYRVTVLAGGVPVRVIEVGSPGLTYTAADQTADFGSLPSGFDFSVTQVSPVFGPGVAAMGRFDA